MGRNYNSTTVLPLTEQSTFSGFTGTTIPDGSTPQQAWQALETAVETAVGIDTFLELTDTPGAYVASNFMQVNGGGTAVEFQTAAQVQTTLSIDDLVTLSGVALGAANLGTFTGSIITDNSTNKVAFQEIETDLEALQTAMGIAAEAVNMGTYTGSTITDNQTAKQNIQELETALEAVTDTSIYAGDGSLTGNRVVTMATNTLTFDGTAGDVVINDGSLAVGVDLTVTGDLTVNGTTTTVNSTTVSVDDKNIELGSVATPTDVTADGGGITLKGATDKTINWVNATDMWTFNQGIDNSSGGYVANYTASAAGNYTVLTTDYTIAKTGITGGGDTVTLPAAPVSGQIFKIKDASGTAGTNNLTVDVSGGGTIDGQASIIITVDWGGFGVQFDGTNYIIIEG